MARVLSRLVKCYYCGKQNNVSASGRPKCHYCGKTFRVSSDFTIGP